MSHKHKQCPALFNDLIEGSANCQIKKFKWLKHFHKVIMNNIGFILSQQILQA
jgi:hypothetical protein